MIPRAFPTSGNGSQVERGQQVLGSNHCNTGLIRIRVKSSNFRIAIIQLIVFKVFYRSFSTVPPRAPPPTKHRSVTTPSLETVDKPSSLTEPPPFAPSLALTAALPGGAAAPPNTPNKKSTPTPPTRKTEGYATSNTQDLCGPYREASIRAAWALIPKTFPTSAQGNPLALKSRANARRSFATSR